jgi:preprotein translocase subunit Sec63
MAIFIVTSAYIGSLMKPYTAEAVREAAEVLGITDQASLNEIRHRYHELMKTWHPDVTKTESSSSLQMAIRINESYRLLVEYCMTYQLSFRSEDLTRTEDKSPSGYWMGRFGDDPIWG